ncbi:Heat shock protein DnaJ domain protein [Salmonella enterica subsp. arizonae]|nr:Heat shock protein DnaJ domain protein [Salmonella enterica subsp. arizonae]
MNKIIKRLEIIKSAIELEDEEIIHQQLIYLKNEPQDAVISTIAEAIEARRFSDAMQEISAWLQAQRALSTWQDPAIAASKLELKALEAQLRDLIDKRNARVQILDDFNDLYHLRLGPLMSRILELRKQLAVSMQRKQEAEIKTSGKGLSILPAIYFPGRGSTGNVKAAVDRIECRLTAGYGDPSTNPATDGVNHRVAGGNSRAGSRFFSSG